MFKKLFIPSDDSDLTSMALLVARLWFGLAMMFNHGFDKFAHFKDLVGTFPDPLGLGQEASLVLVIMAEVGAALLLTDLMVAGSKVSRRVFQSAGETREATAPPFQTSPYLSSLLEGRAAAQAPSTFWSLT